MTFALGAYTAPLVYALLLAAFFGPDLFKYLRAGRKLGSATTLLAQANLLFIAIIYICCLIQDLTHG